MKSYLPAIDDLDLRKQNTKKVVTAIDHVGKHFKELKQQNRINFIVGLSTALIILLFLVGILVVSYSAGGSFMDNLFDKEAVVRRYNCTSEEGYNTIFRSAEDSLDFKELYNASCVYYSVKDK